MDRAHFENYRAHTFGSLTKHVRFYGPLRLFHRYKLISIGLEEQAIEVAQEMP